MIFIGLLTHEQKQAGYFVSQDEDFIYLFHGRNGRPRCVAVFLYDTTTVKEIRDKATEDMQVALRIYKGDKWTINGGRIPIGAVVNVVKFCPRRTVIVEYLGEKIITKLWCLQKLTQRRLP